MQTDPMIETISKIKPVAGPNKLNTALDKLANFSDDIL